MRIARNHKQMGSHIPVLLKVIPKTEGAVCEMGAGIYSTPILHLLTQGRTLYTYETDKEYLHYAHKFQTKNHRIRNMDTVDFDRHWSVVFIDHYNKPRGRRGDDAMKFKNADIIILHDTEQPEEYGYDKVFPHFKYRADFTECVPNTSIVSNVIDVTKWLN
jgi:hypothetical protein